MNLLFVHVHHCRRVSQTCGVFGCFLEAVSHANAQACKPSFLHKKIPQRSRSVSTDIHSARIRSSNSKTRSTCQNYSIFQMLHTLPSQCTCIQEKSQYNEHRGSFSQIALHFTLEVYTCVFKFLAAHHTHNFSRTCLEVPRFHGGQPVKRHPGQAIMPKH